MTRIIAGSAKGRRIRVPDRGVRPTSDRVREAMFSAVSALIDDWQQESVLDVFAGSGALGLEALSRGARRATFIEKHGSAAATISKNLAGLGLQGRVLELDALRSDTPASDLGLTPATVTFADPPYDFEPSAIAMALRKWQENRWLADGCLIVLEGPRRWGDFIWPAGWESLRSRTYGDTRVWYGSAEAESREGQ